MREFKAYCKKHLCVAIYLALCSISLTIVFLLNHIPLAPVLYALGLCAFFGMLFVSVRYIQFHRRHLLLETLLTDITTSIDHLPEPESLLEQDYQMLLSHLFEAKATLTTNSAKRYQELLEYYTMWAHQIKTPIAAMQLILQSNDSPEYLELRSELFKIQQYVEMVLYYLRLDSHSSDFLFRSCKLDQILRSAIHTYAGQFIRRKVKLVYHGTDSTVLTDEKWLQFVVEQILSNALKYAPGGTVTIQLEGDVLVIQDTGIGIAEEDLPRIFEKGFTGLNGRGPQRSTGIGLYLCRQITSRLGHIITIESQPGQGTTVRLDLSHKFLEFD